MLQNYKLRAINFSLSIFLQNFVLLALLTAGNILCLEPSDATYCFIQDMSESSSIMIFPEHTGKIEKGRQFLNLDASDCITLDKFKDVLEEKGELLIARIELAYGEGKLQHRFYEAEGILNYLTHGEYLCWRENLDPNTRSNIQKIQFFKLGSETIEGPVEKIDELVVEKLSLDTALFIRNAAKYTPQQKFTFVCNAMETNNPDYITIKDVLEEVLASGRLSKYMQDASELKLGIALAQKTGIQDIPRAQKLLERALASQVLLEKERADGNYILATTLDITTFENTQRAYELYKRALSSQYLNEQSRVTIQKNLSRSLVTAITASEDRPAHQAYVESVLTLDLLPEGYRNTMRWNLVQALCLFKNHQDLNLAVHFFRPLINSQSLSEEEKRIRWGKFVTLYCNHSLENDSEENCQKDEPPRKRLCL